MASSPSGQGLAGCQAYAEQPVGARARGVPLHAGMSADVVHVPEKSRFEVTGTPEPAVLVYERGDGEVALLHTIVPREREGEGVGSRLAEAAVAWAREQQLEVVPVCSFVQAWLERHPEALEG